MCKYWTQCPPPSYAFSNESLSQTSCLEDKGQRSCRCRLEGEKGERSQRMSEDREKRRGCKWKGRVMFAGWKLRVHSHEGNIIFNWRWDSELNIKHLKLPSLDQLLWNNVFINIDKEEKGYISSLPGLTRTAMETPRSNVSVTLSLLQTKWSHVKEVGSLVALWETRQVLVMEQFYCCTCASPSVWDVILYASLISSGVSESFTLWRQIFTETLKSTSVTLICTFLHVREHMWCKVRCWRGLEIKLEALVGIQGAISALSIMFTVAFISTVILLQQQCMETRRKEAVKAVDPQANNTSGF